MTGLYTVHKLPVYSEPIAEFADLDQAIKFLTDTPKARLIFLGNKLIMLKSKQCTTQNRTYATK